MADCQNDDCKCLGRIYGPGAKERCHERQRARVQADQAIARAQKDAPLLRLNLPTAKYGTVQAAPVAEVWVNPTILRTISEETARAAGCTEPVDVQQSGTPPQLIPVHPVDHAFCALLIKQGRTTINVRRRLS